MIRLRGRLKKRKTRPKRVKKAELGRTVSSIIAFVAVEAVRNIFKFASLIKCVPFEVLPSSTGRLRVRPYQKWWQLWLYYTSHAVIYTYAIFQAYSFPRVIFAQGLTTESALHMAYIVEYLLGVLYFGAMLANSSTYVELINGLDSVMELSNDWSVTRWNQVSIAVISVYYFGVLLASLTPIVLLMYVLMPAHSRYLYSALPADLQTGPFFVAGAVLELIVYIWIATLLLAYYCYWCIYTFQQVLWLEALFGLADTAGCDDEKWTSLIASYRTLKCLNIIHNDFHRNFNAGFNIVLLIILVLLLYCSLTAYGLLPALLYPLFPGCSVFGFIVLLALYPYISRWEQKSEDFLTGSAAMLRPLKIRGDVYAALYREVRALTPVSNEIGRICTHTFDTSKGVIEQVIDNLLLLLSL